MSLEASRDRFLDLVENLADAVIARDGVAMLEVVVAIRATAIDIAGPAGIERLTKKWEMFRRVADNAPSSDHPMEWVANVIQAHFVTREAISAAARGQKPEAEA